MLNDKIVSSEEARMKFGYFTLSDNRFPDNPRTPEAFLHDIISEAIHADRIGMNSVWIGEHHFNRRGSIPCPGTANRMAAPCAVTSSTSRTHAPRRN